MISFVLLLHVYQVTFLFLTLCTIAVALLLLLRYAPAEYFALYDYHP